MIGVGRHECVRVFFFSSVDALYIAYNPIYVYHTYSKSCHILSEQPLVCDFLAWYGTFVLSVILLIEVRDCFFATGFEHPIIVSIYCNLLVVLSMCRPNVDWRSLFDLEVV